MTKKQMVLLGAVALVGVYLCFFVDWFASEDLQVTHAVRLPSSAKQPRPNSPDLGRPVSPVAFTLNRKCRLTELQVVNAAELATNKYAHPLWHLVSKSASAPTKGFVYGGSIRGMRPSVPNAEADPLQPNVTYRLVLQTDDLKVEHDFQGPPARTARR
jgi:hypothetical protein